jgi:hypothetical protein
MKYNADHLDNLRVKYNADRFNLRMKYNADHLDNLRMKYNADRLDNLR